MSNQVTRRNFLTTTSAAIPMAMLAQPTLQHDMQPASAAFVRRDVGNILATDQVIVSYKNAITAMQNLPATNPLSWAYQAAIHGTMLTNNLSCWNTCQHGSILFWSWHRMYLYWFERIIRNMASDPNWALPYWNYSSLAERTLPLMFQTGGGVLYVLNRGAGWNAGTAAFPSQDVDYSAGFALKSFYPAQSQIETLPHNQVHVDIGGWMGFPSTAGQDPIFYLHHANIDRLWSQWLAQGGGRADPVSDINWTSPTSCFYDENGTQVKMSACEILRTAQQLNYAYENECSEVNNYCYTCCIGTWGECCITALALPPFDLGPLAVTVPIGVLADQYWQAIETHGYVLLQLENVQALQRPGTSWDVYVGFPNNGVQPYPESPHFVGSVALFAAGIHEMHHGEFQPAEFEFVINRAVLATQKGVPLSLTFVPHSILIDGKPSQLEVLSPVTIGQVSLAIGRDIQPSNR